MPVDSRNPDTRRPGRFPIPLRARLGLAAAGLVALGGAAGAVMVAETRPAVSMAPATPVAIRSLSSGGIVTIRGRVAEIFGNKVIVADGTGRALVDLGREGDERSLATVGEPVTVQGRFDRGFLHAAFLIGPDNKVLSLAPLAPPPHGPHGRPGPDGGPDGGPHGGPDGGRGGPDGPPPRDGRGPATPPSAPVVGAQAPAPVAGQAAPAAN